MTDAIEREGLDSSVAGLGTASGSRRAGGGHRFAWWSAAVLLALCVLPLVLAAAGVSFSSTTPPLTAPALEAMAGAEPYAGARLVLRGDLVHTLLEWTAVCAAVFVGLLAFVQFRLTREDLLPIVGTALLCAGAVDAFHTLAADRLVPAVVDNRSLVPFTWAISRLFNAVIPLTGVGYVLLRGRHHLRLAGGWFAMANAVLVLAAYAIVQACAASGSLPRTMYPGALVPRPYDLVPLVAFVLCGLVVFPRYCRQRPTFFAVSLLLSLIPQIATQLYMAFGSVQLYDAAFDVAHGLKVLAYTVPLCGLVAEFVHTHRGQQETEARLREYSELLEEGNDDLEEATALAESMARAKADFLANMSHEIRTPMAAILGYTDLLAEDIENPEQREALEIVRRNGRHLLALINDILDLSKLEAGQMMVERIECSLPEIVIDVESLMQVKAEEKGLKLGIEHDGPVPRTIVSDPTRIRQVLLNLMGNAIKFTESGRVGLAVRMLEPPEAPERRIEFRVRDTGIGLTGEQLAVVFRSFQQADTSTRRKYGGTGLGLSISRRLVDLLGGSITVESAPGEGSCFTVSVPIGRSTAGELVEDLNAMRALAKGEAAPRKDSGTAIRVPGRILLAEDGPDNQRLISLHLNKAGAEVEIAENGRVARDRALDALAAGIPFDVILMDMQMPVMDGYQATAALRGQGYRRPIIALTAHAMSGDRRKCLAAGCDEFLTKPIDRARLLETIRAYLPQAAAGAR